MWGTATWTGAAHWTTSEAARGHRRGTPTGWRRQQTALRALLDKAASSGLLADPIQLLRLLDALSRAVSVDETLSNGSLQELGLQMHGLRTSAVQFLVCPTAGLGQEGGQSVVYLDDSRSAELWEALRSDSGAGVRAPLSRGCACRTSAVTSGIILGYRPVAGSVYALAAPHQPG